MKDPPAPSPQSTPVAAAAATGSEMMALARRLYPICRSITGDGVRETLAILGEHIPLAVSEVASGTPVFDWTVPDEWNIRDAWIRDPAGERVVDFRASNLHVLNYSVPVRRRLTLAELRPRLHTLPEHPDWIPYRTSYYKKTWGFCLGHGRLESLAEGTYEVAIDSRLEPGHLTWGECLLPGASAEEVLISCHVCHPSLANDNLSGIAVCTFLAAALAGAERRFTYRFLFIPGTIGSITWLAGNEGAAGRVRAGLVAANLGDPGGFHYKSSRRGDTRIDRAARLALAETGEPFAVEDFVPYGYDERQYCSPGFDLPVGSLTRTPYGRYPEYHTSADDLELLRPESLAGSLAIYRRVVELLEERDSLPPVASAGRSRTADRRAAGRRYRSLNPKCEPQLGKRGLYGSLGGKDAGREGQLALLWVLNLSDGEHTLDEIVERSGMASALIEEATERLLAAELLRPA
jgi:aminopeptidase-like protein